MSQQQAAQFLNEEESEGDFSSEHSDSDENHPSKPAKHGLDEVYNGAEAGDSDLNKSSASNSSAGKPQQDAKRRKIEREGTKQEYFSLEDFLRDNILDPNVYEVLTNTYDGFIAGGGLNLQDITHLAPHRHEYVTRIKPMLSDIMEGLKVIETSKAPIPTGLLRVATSLMAIWAAHVSSKNRNDRVIDKVITTTLAGISRPEIRAHQGMDILFEKAEKKYNKSRESEALRVPPPRSRGSFSSSRPRHDRHGSSSSSSSSRNSSQASMAPDQPAASSGRQGRCDICHMSNHTTDQHRPRRARGSNAE